MRCSNCLIIEGSKKNIKKFISQKGGEGFFLSHFIPMPVEYGHTDEGYRPKEVNALLVLKYGFDNADEWCYANWGTMYDEVSSHYNKRTHSFSFTTSRPPVIAIIRISLFHPGLRFVYGYKLDKISAEDMSRKWRKYIAQEGLLEYLGKWGRFVIQNGWVKREEYEKQNKGKLAAWLEHIHERDKELRAPVQKKGNNGIVLRELPKT